MKRIAIIIVAVALTLGGCAQFGDIARTVTTTITNPVDAVDIYRVKNTYAATLELAISWRQYCWSKPYAALMKDPASKVVCQNRRSVVRAVQSARPKAAAAIRSAENFVRDYPTLNAASAISAAWGAVTALRSAIPATN